MNCNECKTEMCHLLDRNTDTALSNALHVHIAGCMTCKEAYNDMQDVVAVLQPRVSINAPLLLQQNIINELKKDTTMKQAKAKRVQFSPVIKRILAVAAVAIIIFVIPFLSNKNNLTGNAAKASTLFEMAIKAGDMITNMIIKCSIRTDAKDNFALVGKDYDMVEHTITKTFDAPEKWRVEKPGRTVLFDGNNQYLWVPEIKQAVKGPKDANYIDWLKILLDPSSILWKEKEEAKNDGSAIDIKDANAKTFVTITSKAQGNFMNDYMKNRSIAESDNRREYVFDSKTKLLKGLKVYLLENKHETLIFTIEDIDYNTVPPADAFTITLPEGAVWQELNLAVTNENFSNISSKRAAELIFSALSKNDVEADKEVWAQFNYFTKKLMASTYGGVQVIRIGESFKSGKYPGEFVPYEIKLKDGTVKKWKLALRNDNANKVWVVDGGL